MICTEPIAHLSDNHLRVVRFLSDILHAKKPEHWLRAHLVWKARLDESERERLLLSLLLSLPLGTVLEVIEAALGRWHMPEPPLLDPISETAEWPFWAAPELVNAMALACFKAMPPNDKAAFIEHLRDREAT